MLPRRTGSTPGRKPRLVPFRDRVEIFKGSAGIATLAWPSFLRVAPATIPFFKDLRNIFHELRTQRAFSDQERERAGVLNSLREGSHSDASEAERISRRVDTRQ